MEFINLFKIIKLYYNKKYNSKKYYLLILARLGFF